MAIASTESLIDVLRRNFLLPRAQADEVASSLQAQFQDPAALAKELQRRGWLTPYQVEHLLYGDPAALLLGEYVILQPLGEGSMGQVFKARHRLMNRVVAVKVVRKELLSDPEAIERFRREIHTAAQMSHPNVVAAFDAAQIGDTQMLVMEYVEGMDLGQMVQQNGALPVEVAVDYIRQAATGLQHAHERGLIHRDIKPVNLLVAAKGGVVKILDMGLARLQSSQTNLTQEGALIGTPAYIAPEQGLDSHQADIRSDIYSLGCVFYYLLSGQMPFYGESLAKVLVKHLFEEPTPIEHLRFEVPKGLAAVLRKMMAKNLKDRFQTPIDVAEALRPWCAAPGAVVAPAAAPRPVAAPPRTAAPAPSPPPPKPPTVRSTHVPTHPAAPPLAPPTAVSRPREPVAAPVARLSSGTQARPAPASTGWRPGDPKRTAPPEPTAPAPSRSSGSTAWRPPSGRRRRPQTLVVIGVGVLVVGLATACFVLAFLASRNANPTASGTGIAKPSGPDSARPGSRSTDSESTRPKKGRPAPFVAQRSLLDDLDPLLIPKERREKLPPQTVAVYGAKNAIPQMQSIAFTPDHAHIASLDANGNVLFWDVAKGTSVTLPSPAEGKQERSRALAIAPNGGALAATRGDGKIYLWSLDAATIAEPTVLPGHKGAARALAFSADSRKLATGGQDKTVKLWDLTATPPTLIRDYRGHERGVTTVAFDPLGPTLASGSEDGKVCLWDLRSSDAKLWEVLRAPNADAQVAAVAFSPDGNTLAVVGQDERVRPWDLSGETPRELPALEAHFDKVGAVCFSPDGKSMATADASYRRVIVWDLAAHKPRAGLDWDKLPAAPAAVVFAPDGRHVAVGNADGTIDVLRLAGAPVEDRAAGRAGGLEAGGTPALRRAGVPPALQLEFGLRFSNAHTNARSAASALS